MNCKYVEKVSFLIDGELPPEEIEAVKKHMADCVECRKLETDFLFFRRQIKDAVTDFPESAHAEISRFSVGNRLSVWKNWISLPVPALVLLVLIAISLGAWLIFSRSGRNSSEKAQTPAKTFAPKTSNAPNDVSLARYDGGGRAEIYVVSKQTK